jgi:molecular chaperone HscB
MAGPQRGPFSFVSDMNLVVDDFELFGLPRRFVLDRADLDARRRALQAEVHPDRFAASDAAARRAAMQAAVRVNEAYERLKDPLKRAAYLCELAGAPIGAEDNTAMPADFLDRQMTWREALDEATLRNDLEAIEQDVARERTAAHARLALSLDGSHDTAEAVRQVRALMFVERFAADVDDRLAAFER